MRKIPFESGSCYVFDRGHNAFKELYKICLYESHFVVRAKKNLQYNPRNLWYMDFGDCYHFYGNTIGAMLVPQNMTATHPHIS